MAQFNSRGRLWRAHSMRMRACLVMCAALLSTGCASQSYMGISLVPGQASAELQELARRAQSGEKQAQLDLGTLYEQGKLVPVNVSCALRLYRLAAMDSGGVVWAYMPSPGGGAPAKVISFESPLVHGLEEAKDRHKSLVAKVYKNRNSTIKKKNL